MTEARFTELVNLYLDKEISAHDFELLKAEIAARPDRKRDFAERCRLHKAMHLALAPERARSGAQTLNSRGMAPVLPFPRWLLGSGVAASLLIGLILLPPYLRDTADSSSTAQMVEVEQESVAQRDPMDAFGKPEIRRYTVMRQLENANRHASLVSQMRLMGLRPELTPKEKQFQRVEVTALQLPENSVSQDEMYRRIQGLNATPEPEVLRLEDSYSNDTHAWSDYYMPKFSAFEGL